MTLTETLVAAAIMMTLTAGVFTLVNPAQHTFRAQLELSDMRQRLRAVADGLARDLRMAEDVWPSGGGAITIRLSPIDESEIVTRTYYLKTDATAGASQLMRRDDSGVDLPVVDHITRLEFEYFGEPQPCDASLLRIRRIRVLLRVQAASVSWRGGPLVPDQEVRFDVAPRNMDHGAPSCSS